MKKKPRFRFRYSAKLFLTHILAVLLVSGSVGTFFYVRAMDNLMRSLQSRLQNSAALLSQTIVNVSLSILSFLICFLGCYIVASFLIHLICYVFELPVLRHLDALMGGVFGLARGVLLLFIFFALVPIIQAVVPIQQITDLLNASRLAPLFDSQLILSILGA